MDERGREELLLDRDDLSATAIISAWLRLNNARIWGDMISLLPLVSGMWHFSECAVNHMRILQLICRRGPHQPRKPTLRSSQCVIQNPTYACASKKDSWNKPRKFSEKKQVSNTLNIRANRA